jgi:4-hydroxy-3-methylbut-2-enyl diphosphate reductase
MCFGVRDAIQLAASHHRPISVLGDLVHNESVQRRLRDQGVRFRQSAAEVDTPEVMITAHGTSDRARDALRDQGLHVVEATCPHVRFAHHAVLRLAREGFHPVIVGQRHHVEVQGLTGDLGAFDVVLTEEDVQRLDPRAKFGVAAQTTQPLRRVRRLTDLIRRRFPESEVRLVDTVCQPTKNRQQAAADLARECNVVIVIGGAHSNNTKELVATCSRHCTRVHHVRDARDLCGDWFSPADTVGLTAGTSTPDDLIASVEAWLAEYESLQNQIRRAAPTLP